MDITPPENVDVLDQEQKQTKLTPKSQSPQSMKLSKRTKYFMSITKLIYFQL